jgi:serine/threonine protein kinase
MGNQTGKGSVPVPTYDSSKEGTRETIASWHRYGVNVWDVYEYVDDLGQGHMGQIFHVRRKERSAHNEITRQRSASSGASAGSEPPKPVVKAKPSAKLIPKIISGRGKINEVDVPPKKPLATPPKSPLPPKPILKPSHYGNPTNEIPDIDDGPEDEDVNKIHWEEKTKGRVEHVADHRSEMLAVINDQLGTSDSTDVLSLDSLSSNPKVVFKRHYACKTVLISLVKGGKIEDLLNEIYIMRSLDHPYIIKLYEIYQFKRMY